VGVGGVRAGYAAARAGASVFSLKADIAGSQSATIDRTDTPVPAATDTPAPSPTQAAPAATSTSAPQPTATTATSSSTANTTSAGGGGGKNIIQVVNKKDDSMRLRGHVRLNRIPGPNVSPANVAVAFGQCTGCSTFAVALQIDLISKTASQITPQNSAVAVNAGCNGCTTVADAYQYVIQVDDPVHDTPDDVNKLVNQMNKELDAIQKDPTVTTPAQAEVRVEAVIGQFQSLAMSLTKQRSATTDPQSPNAPSTAPEETDQ
jgi:hypothetical protein